MTLSNFDWTDKASVKWFIMLPTGHEGPYSLESIYKRKASSDLKIWSEGLPSPVTFKSAWEKSQIVVAPEIEEVPVEIPELKKVEIQEDEVPPLPPIPETDTIETLTIPEIPEEAAAEAKAKKYSSTYKILGMSFGLTFLMGFGLWQWVKSAEEFNIRRPSHMSPDLFEKVNADFNFSGWNKKIFFKEYVPADMSHIWLVTGSFQACDVEASFTSVKDRLLAKNDAKIAFKTSGKLKNHILEFNKFDFTNGNKIVPGLYEMDLKAKHCKWDGMAAKMANFFRSPDAEYVTRMKLILYHKGSSEYNSILDELIRKKLALEIKNQNQEELFWQNLQQKFQTLLAITLQIEELMLNFLEKNPAQYSANVNAMINTYTKNFGGFFTEFVIQNEKDFKELEKLELSKMSQKRTYETTVRMTSKNIGFESMKLIEEFQKLKKPSKAQLNQMNEKVKKQFQILKENLEKKNHSTN